MGLLNVGYHKENGWMDGCREEGRGAILTHMLAELLTRLLTTHAH